MKPTRLPVIASVAVVVVITVGLAFNSGTGTLSAFGWRDISLLCPLGAITSMLASKTFVPRAVFALLAVVVIVLLTGRAFCSWACPAPLVARLRRAFSRKPRPVEELKRLAEREDAPSGVRGAEREDVPGDVHAAESEAAGLNEGGSGASQIPGGTAAASSARPLTEEERKLLRGGSEAGCRACSERFPRVDSRHLVLGGAVLSAAVFGFPVFCIICPVGLAFGTILLLIALFGYGDVTWSVVFVPLLLLVEMVFFRKWCARICPMGALLGLIGKLNVTLRPKINARTCLETSRGATCGACTRACEQGINLRNPDLGASAAECTRCLACVEACPTKSVHVKPFAGRVLSGRRIHGKIPDADAASVSKGRGI